MLLVIILNTKIQAKQIAMPSYATLDAEFDYSIESAVYALFVVDENTVDHLRIEIEKRHGKNLFEEYFNIFGERYNVSVHVLNNTIVPNNDVNYILEEESKIAEVDYAPICLIGLDDGYIDAPVSVASGYAISVIVENSMDYCPVSPAVEQPECGNAFDGRFIRLLNTSANFRRYQFSAEKLPLSHYTTSLAPLIIVGFKAKMGKRPLKSQPIEFQYYSDALHWGNHFHFVVGKEWLKLCTDNVNSIAQANIKGYPYAQYVGSTFICSSGAEINATASIVARRILFWGLRGLPDSSLNESFDIDLKRRAVELPTTLRT